MPLPYRGSEAYPPLPHVRFCKNYLHTPWSPAAWVTAIHFYLVFADKEIIEPQRIQNSLAHVVNKESPLTHSVPLLRSLHWLPIKFRIEFKTCLLTYKTFNENQPDYLYAMLTPSVPSRSLRSNNGINFSVPKVKTNTGARAFRSCGPTLWNRLPPFVRSAPSTASF